MIGYRITHVDVAAGELDIEFEGEPAVRINMPEPAPQTGEQLAALVAANAPPGHEPPALPLDGSAAAALAQIVAAMTASTPAAVTFRQPQAAPPAMTMGVIG